MAMLPTDIAMVCAIHTLICGDNTGTNPQCGLQLMCFLADNLGNLIVKQYVSLASFHAEISRFLSPTTLLYQNIVNLCKIDSIDKMTDLMEDSRVFTDNPMSSPNNLLLPNLIKRESYIGLYLRELYVKWSSCGFDEICSVFESYVRFSVEEDIDGNISSLEEQSKLLPYEIGLCDTTLDIKLLSSMSDILPRYLLLNAQKAIFAKDILPAVESLHEYFDFNGQNPLLSKSSMNKIMNHLVALSNGTSKQVACHQHAMLALATMWIRNNEYTQATIAVEETMKMSHQRGDHVTIAHALLLLHYIVEATPQDTIGIISSENVLVRCIQRCTTLRTVRALEIQATTLLVRLRSKKNIFKVIPSSLGIPISDANDNSSIASTKSKRLDQWSDIHSMFPCGDVAAASTEASHGVKGRLPISALWTLLSSTQLDESLLVSSKGGNGCTGRQAKHIPPQANASSNRLETNKQINRADVHDLVTNRVQMLLVAIDFWCNLSMNALALVSCRRLLHTCGNYMSSEDVMLVCSRVCMIVISMNTNRTINALSVSMLTFVDLLRVNSIYFPPSQTLQSSEITKNTLSNIASCHTVIDTLTSMFPSKLPSYLQNIIESNRLMLNVKKNILLKKFDIAFAEAHCLLEILYEYRNMSELYFQSQLLYYIAKAFHDRHGALSALNHLLITYSGTDAGNFGTCQGREQSQVNQMDAKPMSASLLSPFGEFNSHGGQYNCISGDITSYNWLRYVYVLIAISCVHVYVPPHSTSQALCTIQEVIDRSYMECCPIVDSMVATLLNDLKYASQSS